jgi:hypothetical protein
MDIKEDVELMNKTFDESAGFMILNTEPPSTDIPDEVEEDVSTEPQSTEAPSTDSSSTDAPSTEAPADDKDDKDKIIEDLRRQIEESHKRTTVAPSTEAPLSIESVDFLSDVDIEDLINDPKEFNKLLNKIYSKAVDDTRKVLGEGVLKSIPDIVRANVNAMNELQRASDEFYAANEDLKPFKKVVATVFEEISSENPGKTYKEILPKVSEEARKRLELHKTVTQQKAPRLPNSKGRSTPRTKPSTDPLMSEIEKMNMTLGGN